VYQVGDIVVDFVTDNKYNFTGNIFFAISCQQESGLAPTDGCGRGSTPIDP
jgi:hypothetical protein